MAAELALVDDMLALLIVGVGERGTRFVRGGVLILSFLVDVVVVVVTIDAAFCT